MNQPASPSNPDHLGTLAEPHSDHTKRHQLLDIMTIALCGVMCRAESRVEIEQFGNAKLPSLRTSLQLPHGIPSPDTFGGVFATLDPEHVQQCFLGWGQAVVVCMGGQLTPGQVVALDGKRVRHSHDHTNGKAATHVVSAWATEHRLVRGPCKVDAPAALAYVNAEERWPGLRSIAMVEAERTIGAATSRDTGYHISSLAGTGASRTGCTGCWTAPSAETTAGCAKGKRPTTLRCCTRGRSASCAKRRPPRSGSRPDV